MGKLGKLGKLDFLGVIYNRIFLRLAELKQVRLVTRLSKTLFFFLLIPHSPQVGMGERFKYHLVISLDIFNKPLLICCLEIYFFKIQPVI